ncbi:unnamed protein product [Haemonchus placei]|uniref:Secreted protein n=1 Tax=Haemonchus placei TaxID=6290 RepID=A0A0N4WWS1_HAEPC|nr:unnamed protein product [Haemonchus placei]
MTNASGSLAVHSWKHERPDSVAALALAEVVAVVALVRLVAVAVAVAQSTEEFRMRPAVLDTVSSAVGDNVVVVMERCVPESLEVLGWQNMVTDNKVELQVEIGGDEVEVADKFEPEPVADMFVEQRADRLTAVAVVVQLVHRRKRFAVGKLDTVAEVLQRWLHR